MRWLSSLIVGAAVAQHDWQNTAELQKYPVFAVVASRDSGVSVEIGEARKHAANPLWEQDRPWEPRIDNGYPNVIHDPADPLGAWRMWYGFLIWEYATSEDGLKWDKPDLGMFDLGTVDHSWAKYGKHNNVIMAGTGMGIYKDQHERDPNQRFKAFGGPSCFIDRGEPGINCQYPVQGTAVSPDGLYWHNARNLTWPYDAGDPAGRHQKYDTHQVPPCTPVQCISVCSLTPCPKPTNARLHDQNLFFDAAKNKYIATTRDLKPFPWRAVAMTESLPGAFAFDTSSEPPAVVQGNANEQPYSQITFPYYGIYLGLTSVFDAANGETEGRVHLRLSWSLDAENWNWVDGGGLTGKDFIPLGTTIGNSINPFDSHIIFAAAYPIRMKDDSSVRVYYMGGNGPHGGARNSSFGLATVRPDGFASMAGSGTIVTRLVRCTGPTLVVNVDVLGAGGSVRVGVAGSVAPGLSPSDAIPVTSDVTDHAVVFSSGHATLANLVGKDIQLEIVLDRAAVYTVGFRQH